MTKPDRYAVLGNPIQHSFSPEIHQSFAAELGENISYEKIEVPIGQFAEKRKSSSMRATRAATSRCPSSSMPISLPISLRSAREAAAP